MSRCCSEIQSKDVDFSKSYIIKEISEFSTENKGFEKHINSTELCNFKRDITAATEILSYWKNLF